MSAAPSSTSNSTSANGPATASSSATAAANTTSAAVAASLPRIQIPPRTDAPAVQALHDGDLSHSLPTHGIESTLFSSSSPPLHSSTSSSAQHPALSSHSSSGSGCSSASVASLYPAPTPPLPETPHPHLPGRSEFSPGCLDPVGEAAFPVSPASMTLPSGVQMTVPPAVTSAASAASLSVSVVAPPKITWRRKLVLVLVGLPARGKSYISFKLMGYLRWRGLNANLFNVGKHRRQVAESQTLPQSSEYFSPENTAATHQRDEIAMEVLDCMLDWLASGGDVSIFDATNTTSARRRAVLARCQARSSDLRVIFLESICDDPRVLETNYRVKAMNSPDYKDMPLADALRDLRMRVHNYEKVYESIHDDELSYIKLHNLASKVICNKIHGQLSHAIAAYLMSIHVQPRPIFFVRAGHSESERGEIEIAGQQYQDRQILKLPEVVDAAGAASPTVPSAAPATATASTPPAPHDFHIPYTVAMAANLDSAGKAFARRLAQFITQKTEEYSAKVLERGRQATEAAAAAAAEAAREAEAEALQHGGEGSSSTTAHAPAPTIVAPVATLSDFTPPSSVAPSPIASPAPASSVALSAAAAVSATDSHLPLVVYTSTLPRAIQSAQNLKDRAYIFEAQPSLNMMDTGVCSGMDIEDIRQKMPEELGKWQKHKYKYRFPGGESQADRAKSLEPLVFELERQTLPVLVVSHMSTLQVLLGFFYGSKRSVDSYYSLWIPQHVVLELIPHQYGWLEIRHDLSEEACAADDWDSGTSSTNSPARSPRRHTVPVPVQLGAEAADEVERFNLQVVARDAGAHEKQSKRNKSKSRAQAKAMELALGAAASEGLQVPRAHDRSISVPAHDGISCASSPSSSASSAAAAGASSSSAASARFSPPTPQLPEARDLSSRKVSSGKSIGKSSQVKILGEADFYAS